MRLAYCGHSHHRITGSTRFLLEALRSRAEVEEHWLDHWRTGARFDPAPLLHAGYDGIVVCQLEDVALQLAAAGLANLTFFPMYDSCHAAGDSYWRRMGDAKVVCFSSTLHARLQRLGLRTRFVRYFPEVPASRARAGPALAGYFWQRRQDVTWSSIRALVGDATFDLFTLHEAIDPSGGAFVRPSEEEVRRHRIRTTRWFADPDQAAADLLRHNVYFAPRLREGIGMSFLEAMALGFLVVAPDRPTMNEYIVSGVNGLLYDPERPRPLDLSAAPAMGERARQHVALGRQAWCRSLPALLDLVEAPNRDVAIQAPLEALDPQTLAWGGSRRRPLPPPGGSAAGRRPVRRPAITVGIVAQGRAEGLEETLGTVLRQELPDVEILGLAHGPGQAAADGLRRLGPWLDGWRSEPALGPAAARNALASAATGRHVLFLRPGDRLASRHSLAAVLGEVPAEIVLAHHLARLRAGEELVTAADLATLGSRLRRGELDWELISGAPHPSSTLWQAALLRREPFHQGPGLLWHEERLLRAARDGTPYRHALAVLCSIPVAPETARARIRRLESWGALAVHFTDRPEEAAHRLAAMRREAGRRELDRLAARELFLHLGRVPGAARELKRRLRARLRRRMAARTSQPAGHPLAAPEAHPEA